MIRRPPRSTRTDTLFPYTPLVRSALQQAMHAIGHGLAADHQQARVEVALHHGLAPQMVAGPAERHGIVEPERIGAGGRGIAIQQHAGAPRKSNPRHRKSTRTNSSHKSAARITSSACKKKNETHI